MTPVQADILAALNLAKERGMHVSMFFEAKAVYHAGKWAGLDEEESTSLFRAYCRQPVDFRNRMASLFGLEF